jgi:hypothetical protein
MGYRPLPESATPPAAQQPQQQQQTQPQQQATTPTPTPTPRVSAPTPKPSTSIKPVVPKPTIKREPPDDAKAWITPVDPYSKSSEPAPQPSESALPVSERKTDKANSTEALVGLGGVFILIGGISAIAWTRFRRYDDEQLAELLNPDGKLPSMLDDSAADMSGKELMGASGVAAGSTEMVMTADGPVLKKNLEKQQSAEAPTIKAPVIRPASTLKAPLVPPAGNGSHVPNGATPANGSHASNGAAAPNGTNGTHAANGTQAANGTHAANGTNGAGSYRQEVEAELQRILKEAGLDTELEGILSDARAEAERQGVPMDSDLMLRALTEEGNGSGKLSDSAKGELKQRFQRIAAEEQGQVGPTPDQ